MRGSVGEEQVRGRRRVRRRGGGGGVASRHEVRGGVRGGGQRARRQLLLHGPLLDVVAELGGGHAVRTLAARLQLGAAELGLREGGGGECEGLRAERRRGGEGRGGGGRRRRRGLHRPEALRFGVECAGHLEFKIILVIMLVLINHLKYTPNALHRVECNLIFVKTPSGVSQKKPKLSIFCHKKVTAQFIKDTFKRFQHLFHSVAKDRVSLAIIYY